MTNDELAAEWGVAPDAVWFLRSLDVVGETFVQLWRVFRQIALYLLLIGGFPLSFIGSLRVRGLLGVSRISGDEVMRQLLTFFVGVLVVWAVAEWRWLPWPLRLAVHAAVGITACLLMHEGLAVLGA